MRPEKFIAVSARDEALETERLSVQELFEYIRTRDEKLIGPMLRPGSRPVRYRVREIPTDLWFRYVEAVPEGPEQWCRAFLAGVERVENIQQPDGTFLEAFEGASGDRPMPEAALNRFRPHQIREIGMVAWQHSFLARQTECSFVPPHSFLATLIERRFRSVDASQTSQDQNSGAASDAEATEKAPPSLTAQSSAPTVESSALHTAVTAPGTPFLVSA